MDKSMHLPHIKAILYLQVAFEALMWSTSHFFFQCHFQRIPVYLTLIAFSITFFFEFFFSLLFFFFILQSLFFEPLFILLT